MKHDIIKTENYLLVVDESEIKVHDFMYFWNGQSGSIHRHREGYDTENIYGVGVKIIAHLPLNGSPILEGVDLLPPLEQEDDVEKLAFGQYGGGEDNRTINAFIDGYNQSLEDNKERKYTEEDLRKAWNAAYIDAMSIDEETYKPLFFEDFIQSLSQPKMPIGFECEMEQYVIQQSMPENVIGYRSKTTTNPQGQTQWAGKYIY